MKIERRMTYYAGARYGQGPLGVDAAGVQDVIFMLPENGQFLFHEIDPATRGSLLQTFTKMKTAAGAARVWITFHCFDYGIVNRDIKGSQFVHFTEDLYGRVLRNAQDVSKLAHAAGLHGLMVDSEHYGATEDADGGNMRISQAWVNEPYMTQRGIRFAEAVAPLALSQFVWHGDAVEHAGWRTFWRAANEVYQKRSGVAGVLLAEDSYLGGNWGAKQLKALDRRIGTSAGLVSASGYWLKTSVSKWGGELRKRYWASRAGAWIYDPQGVALTRLVSLRAAVKAAMRP